MSSLVRLRPLAAELNIPPEWLRDAALTGRVPSLRVHNYLYFHRPAVERAMVALASRPSIANAAEDPTEFSGGTLRSEAPADDQGAKDV